MRHSLLARWRLTRSVDGRREICRGASPDGPLGRRRLEVWTAEGPTGSELIVSVLRERTDEWMWFEPDSPIPEIIKTVPLKGDRGAAL